VLTSANYGGAVANFLTGGLSLQARRRCPAPPGPERAGLLTVAGAAESA